MLMNNEGEYGKYIIQELNNHNTGTPEFQEMYNRFAKRILWIDGNRVPGAFQMNTSWYKKVPERDPIFDEHAHDSDELIGLDVYKRQVSPREEPRQRAAIWRLTCRL